MVIVLDASDSSQFVTIDDIANLREVAISIIRSLTQKDKVSCMNMFPLFEHRCYNH